MLRQAKEGKKIDEAFLLNNEFKIGMCFIAILLFTKVVISLFMKAPYIFSDEHSYFGMADKIIKLNFDKIYNSHMPGYSLLIVPAYAMASNALKAYHAALILNCIIGTLSYPLVFYLCKYVFQMKKYYPILIAVMTSLASSFQAYNYVVLSETLQTVFYLVFFVLFCDIICRKDACKKWKWLVLGLVLGFLPIIKIQACILLILFSIFSILYQLTKGQLLEKKGLLGSSATAIIFFAIFRFAIFPNIGLYAGQREDNLAAMLTVFEDGEHFFAFLHISFAELAYFVVGTGVIPLFFVLLYLIQSFKNIWKNKEKLLISLFTFFVFAGNVMITIIHAYWVYASQSNTTVYARYLDFLQPILISVGLIFMVKYTGDKMQKVHVIMMAIMGILVFVIYPTVNKIEVNTYSVRLFHSIPILCYFLIFLFSFVFLGFFLKKRSTLSFSFVFLVCLYLAMDYSAVWKQLSDSDHMARTFGAAYYLALNPFQGEDILLDSDLVGMPMKEDYISGTEEREIDPLLTTFKYEVTFWGIKNNTVSQHEISRDDLSYIYTDKLLPREVLSTNGNIFLYDKESHTEYNASADTIFRTTSNVELVSSDTLRIKGEETFTKLFIDNIKNIEISFIYADNISVSSENAKIICYINDTPLERIPEDNMSNKITFRYNGEERISIESLRTVYSGEYSDIILQGDMYLESMNIKYDW